MVLAAARLGAGFSCVLGLCHFFADHDRGACDDDVPAPDARDLGVSCAGQCQGFRDLADGGGLAGGGGGAGDLHAHVSVCGQETRVKPMVTIFLLIAKFRGFTLYSRNSFWLKVGIFASSSSFNPIRIHIPFTFFYALMK